ncbi:TPA: class I SAM-dependent methyltransferase, partial [Acinetobacter baumannii]|nr:class I SAM-dependent methyltransferase [Acinetobacter baumannii]
MIDQIFTPDALANELVQFYSLSSPPLLVADFAVGEGSLIQAAHKYWPEAKYIVNDIDQNILNKIKLKNAEIDYYNEDFLVSNFTKLFEKIDLILLNPPFSHGNRKMYVWDENNISSGIALFFIYKSLNYLTKNGQLLAILPNGCFSTERDALGLKYIQDFYHFEKFEIKNNPAFYKARPNTSIVRITKQKDKLKSLNNISHSIHSQFLNNFKVFRGNIQLHKEVTRGPIPLLHTTSFKNNNVEPINFIFSTLPTVKGRMLIIPRVGNFNKNHIIIYYAKNNIHLSDCLFSIKCKNLKEATLLK